MVCLYACVFVCMYCVVCVCGVYGECVCCVFVGRCMCTVFMCVVYVCGCPLDVKTLEINFNSFGMQACIRFKSIFAESSLHSGRIKPDFQSLCIEQSGCVTHLQPHSIIGPQVVQHTTHNTPDV